MITAPSLSASLGESSRCQMMSAMEAAEALTQLVASTFPPRSYHPRQAQPRLVSDDEMSMASSASSGSSFSSSSSSSSPAPSLYTSPSLSSSSSSLLLRPPSPSSSSSYPLAPSLGEKTTSVGSPFNYPITGTRSTVDASIATATTIGTTDTGNKPDIFPLRLHRMLSDPTVRDLLTWLPHGQSFVVLRPDLFAASVLPRYFPESAPSPSASASASTWSSSKAGGGTTKSPSPVPKYPSFTRKLNRWGFRQISKGPDAGAFHHPLFRRDAVELCTGMECQKGGGRKGAKAALSPEAESKKSGKRNAECDSPAHVERDVAGGISPTDHVSALSSSSHNPRVPIKKRKFSHHQANTELACDSQNIANRTSLSTNTIAAATSGNDASSRPIPSLPSFGDVPRTHRRESSSSSDMSSSLSSLSSASSSSPMSSSPSRYPYSQSYSAVTAATYLPPMFSATTTTTTTNSDASLSVEHSLRRLREAMELAKKSASAVSSAPAAAPAGQHHQRQAQRKGQGGDQVVIDSAATAESSPSHRPQPKSSVRTTSSPSSSPLYHLASSPASKALSHPTSFSSPAQCLTAIEMARKNIAEEHKSMLYKAFMDAMR